MAYGYGKVLVFLCIVALSAYLSYGSDEWSIVAITGISGKKMNTYMITEPLVSPNRTKEQKFSTCVLPIYTKRIRYLGRYILFTNNLPRKFGSWGSRFVPYHLSTVLKTGVRCYNLVTRRSNLLSKETYLELKRVINSCSADLDEGVSSSGLVNINRETRNGLFGPFQEFIDVEHSQIFLIIFLLVLLFRKKKAMIVKQRSMKRFGYFESFNVHSDDLKNLSEENEYVPHRKTERETIQCQGPENIFSGTSSDSNEGTPVTVQKSVDVITTDVENGLNIKPEGDDQGGLQSIIKNKPDRGNYSINTLRRKSEDTPRVVQKWVVVDACLSDCRYDLQSTKEEGTPDRQDEMLCKICFLEYVSVVFLPCSHMVACECCSNVLRRCAVCRSVIKGTLKADIQ